MTIEERLSLLEQQIAAQVPTPTEYYTSRWSGEEIDNCIASLSNQNLVDNAYFKGGGSQQGGGQFPINQRGQNSYNATGGIMDRWFLATGAAIGGVAVTLSADGLVLNGNTQYQYTLIRQTLSAPVLSGQTYTLSVLLANGTLVQASGQATVEATTWCYLQITPTSYIRAVGLNTVEIVETTETSPIKALKMEAGSHQTLAHQENGQWVINETPDYGEELAKCLFYLEIQNIPINAFIPANVWHGNSGKCAFCLQYANKRITPTISFSGGGRFVPYSSSQVNLTSFFTEAATPSAAGISATLSENLTGGGAGFVDSLGQVIISAEL